jgi:hypothetical protein
LSSNEKRLGEKKKTSFLGKESSSEGALRVVGKEKILHYHQLYINRPEPIAFMPVAVDTSDRIYDDFLRLLFLHTHEWI